MELENQNTISLRRSDRSSNIELLRIICMLLLIAHHSIVHCGALSIENCTNKWIGLLFVPVGKICFDAFVAISAWYTVDSKFKASRFFRIWFQILFYNIVFTGLTALLGNGYAQPITWRTWLGACFPIIGNSHGFAASYVVYYLCTPFLRYVAERLTQRRAALLVGILFLTQVFSSILGSVIFYTQPMTSEILLFVLAYFTAFYLKRWPIKLENNMLALGLIVLFCWFGLVGIWVGNALYPDSRFFAVTVGLSGNELSLNHIIAGFALFLFAKNIKMPKMPRLNLLASTTFGILLFHDHNYFRPVVWGRLIQSGSWLNVPPLSFAVHILASVIVLFVLGAVIDFMRQKFVEAPLMRSNMLKSLCDRLDGIIQQKLPNDVDELTGVHSTCENQVVLPSAEKAFDRNVNTAPVLETDRIIKNQYSRWFSISVLVCVALYWVICIIMQGSNIDAYFVADHHNTGMDYFNMLANLSHDDPWYANANYPAMCFLILRPFFRMLPASLRANEVDGFALREEMIAQLGYFLFILASLFVVWELLQHFIKGARREKILFAASLLFSGPMFFLLERGNLLLLSLAALLGYLALYNSPKKSMRYVGYVCLAFSASIKIYPAIFGLLVPMKKRWKETLHLVAIGAAAFLIPFFCFDGFDSLLAMFRGFGAAANISLGRGAGHNFSFRGLLTLMTAAMGYHNEVWPVWVLLIPLVISIWIIVVGDQEWKKLFGMTLLCIWLPDFSYTYTLVLFFLPLISFFGREQKASRFNTLYTALFVLLVIPYMVPMLPRIDAVTGVVQLPASWASIIINYVTAFFALSLLLEHYVSNWKEEKMTKAHSEQKPSLNMISPMKNTRTDSRLIHAEAQYRMNSHNRNETAPFLSAISTLKYLIAVILAIGCYAGMVFNRAMPFAEGWYTYYAQCINSGEVVYRDFDYLFPPLYIHLVALITKVFGYKVIVLRMIGILFFCLIGILVFLILREIFSEGTSAVAAITATFYLQSEVAQVFYDYIRLMDIFACATILFLIKFIKNINRVKQRHRFLICAGLCNSCFLLVKQNMGLVFCAYSIILIFAMYLVVQGKLRTSFSEELYFLAGLSAPIAIACIFMIETGSLIPFFRQAGSAAIAAKGGIATILFGWIKVNASAFSGNIQFAIIVLIIIGGSYIVKRCIGDIYPANLKGYDASLPLIFSGLCILLFILFAQNEGITRSFDSLPYLSPYGIFQIVFPLFIVWVTRVIICSIREEHFSKRILLCIALSGSYLAISWGCGMSAGLAEGQATIGVALVIALILDNLDFKFSWIFKSAVVVLCLLITLQSATKKMNNTYNWWGLGESDFWDSTECSEDIEVLQGIRMSSETLSAYETVYHVISENTDENSPIYCFPQIPIFYSVCNRFDPGVRAKVQWFDVVSDDSISQDISTIEHNPPAAILIYETSEYAYTSHENLFRGGGISVTRRMKQFLLNYAAEHGYTFYGRIDAGNNNNFLLYYKPDDTSSKSYALEGDGTYESPFLVTNSLDLLWIQNAVDNGNDFSRMYFQQTSDIDLSSVRNWEPIGECGSGFYFRGIYDGAGHVIRNMTIDFEGENVGLFGQLGGIVCNLGLVDSKLSGACVGTISSHAVDENAMIINCYTDSEVSAFRAGGIADNFSGSIINCLSYSTCDGLESAGAISYDCGYSDNVYALYEDGNITSGILDSVGSTSVTYCSSTYLKSGNVLNALNSFVQTGDFGSLYSSVSHDSWVPQVNLVPWGTHEDSCPVLMPQ